MLQDLNEFKAVVAETCCGLMDAAAQPLSLKTEKHRSPETIINSEDPWQELPSPCGMYVTRRIHFIF